MNTPPAAPPELSTASPTTSPVFVLQEGLLPLPDVPQALYFAKDSTWSALPGDIGEQTGQLTLQRGQTLNMNSYFNGFFLDYWRLHTAIARLGVLCSSSGQLRIRVIGHGKAGHHTTLLDMAHPATTDQPIWLWGRADETDGGSVGRLHLEITALTDARIDRIAFVTDAAPPRQVTLAIGLCTFDREILFEKTVRGLHQLAVSTPALRRIHVVNQGRSFARRGLTKVLAHPVFSVIEQANLGGCGGFARAMVETLDSDDPPSHLLIMDDDIVLDPRIVTRMLAFAQYTTAECVIGGQAIELESRSLLQEAGGRIGPNWAAQPIGKDADLGEAAALDLWTQVLDIDYNAWWFCLVPVPAMARCGLPAPIFLHGDDIDYGLRLKAMAVPTIGLPGIGVWHTSFRYKHAGLLHYYDLRNILINASAHPGQSNMPSPLYVFGWVLSFLLVHRYRAARASMMAIRDFLDGPVAALGPDSCTRNTLLRQSLDVLPKPDLRLGVAIAEIVDAPTARPAASLRHQALIFATTFMRILMLPGSRQVTLLVKGFPIPENTKGAAYLLAMGPKADRCLVLRPRRLHLFAATGRALSLALRYALQRRRASRLWAESMADLRSRERWAHEFSRPRD